MATVGAFSSRLPEEYYEEREEREHRAERARTYSENTISGLSESELIQYAMMLSVGDDSAHHQAPPVDHHILGEVSEDVQFEWALKQSMRV